MDSTRVAGLAAAQKAAYRRHAAAKGLLTQARKDGSAGKIAAAAARERAARAEADQIADACIAEMQAITSAGLDSTGRVFGQMRRAWDTGSAVIDALTRPGRDGGQPPRPDT